MSMYIKNPDINLISFPNKVYYDGYTTTNKGITYTVANGGKITIQGTLTEEYSWYAVTSYTIQQLQTGKTYIISGEGLVDKIGLELRIKNAQGVPIQVGFAYAGKPLTYTMKTGETLDRITFVVKGSFEDPESYPVVYPRVVEASELTKVIPYVKPNYENLIPYPYRVSTYTSNGVKYTVQEDGSIEVKGTATDRSYVYFINATAGPQVTVTPGATYTLSGFPAGKSNGVNTLYISLLKDGGWLAEKYDYGGGVTFTVPTDADPNVSLVINIGIGQTVDFLVKPMLVEGSVKLPYIKQGQNLLKIGEIKNGR